jgi:predicted transcriptional regulator
MEIFKLYNYNDKEYYIKLRQLQDKTLILEVKDKGKVLKTYKVVEDATYYYKIQKTQIQSNNIYQLIAEINDRNATNVSNIFTEKLLKQTIEEVQND